VDNLSQYLEYSPTSRYKPLGARVKDVLYKPEVEKNNPLQQSTGIIGLNVQSEPKLTPWEAA